MLPPSGVHRPGDSPGHDKPRYVPALHGSGAHPRHPWTVSTKTAVLFNSPPKKKNASVSIETRQQAGLASLVILNGPLGIKRGILFLLYFSAIVVV